MRKILTTLLIAAFCTISISGYSQPEIFQGKDANKIIEGSDMIRLSDKSDIPSYIRFAKGNEPDVKTFTILLKKSFKITEEISFILDKSEAIGSDKTLYRYSQQYNGATIHDARFTVQTENNLVSSISGTIYSSVDVGGSYSIGPDAIIAIALEKYPSDLYKWQIPGEEALLKDQLNNIEATYFPNAEKILFPIDYPKFTGSYVQCYKVNIYSDKPLFKKDIYINSQTGEIIYEFDELHLIDVPASANTKYSGIQEITTDSYNGSFRLRETGRGNGIETYDMNTGTSYTAAVDFVDTDNYWNNFNSEIDEVASDAHWGAEMTYDYYYYEHGRNSIDNAGFKLKSYIHYDYQYSNAFWDGTRMTYGDGTGSPLVACDIVAHEISHGLTSFTANLDYAYESGAINEGFSDIFGTSIEFYAKPTDANWTIGEDIGFIMRSMSNPNTYDMPDTYLGDYWYTGTGDNGGVHYNSSVLNHWYYLVTVGGSGTNDIGNSFNFSGIGIEDAGAIAFRTLTVYLTNTSQYYDARFFSIMAAIDLYGSCSSEVEAVTSAWYAVGIGPNYVNAVLSDFSADFLEFCETPATVSFLNNSVNGTSFIWDFGDGITSTLLNPNHVYTTYGTFTISLFADGGTCGSDTLIQTSYISIDPANPCVTVMNPSGPNNTQTSCTGVLYDTGGLGNYQDETNSIITINPTGALSVTLTFVDFDFELDYDYLYIYDGPNILSPLIGQYSGAWSSLPNGGVIQSTGSSITLRQTSDVYLTEEGFEVNWQCDYANTAPQTDFYAQHTETCTGAIQFHDNSSNGATEWLWDFGDGTTDNIQHPLHTYNSDGLYSVKLVSSNPFGIDSVTFSDYILVTSPVAPTVTDGLSCGPGTVDLNAYGSGAIVWFTEELGGDLVATGENFTTPYLSTSEQYWAESYALQDFGKVGKTDDTGGGGFFNSAFVHYLVFDCYTDIHLVSVKVFAASAGNRLIKLNDATGSLIDQTIVNIPQGESRIILDFDIPAGSDYQLAGPESPDLYRNNDGLTYPYDLFGIASVKYSSANTDPTGYYYYFYDWEIMDANCQSERVLVNADILDAPVAEFSFINDSGYVSFSNTSISSTEYIWDFGDGTTSTSVNPYHSFNSTGEYTVTLISTNDCGSDTISYNITISVTDIEDITGIYNLEVYPNPVSSTLFISFSNSGIAVENIELYDILGNVVWSETDITTGSNYAGQIDMNNIAKGVYFLRLNISNSLISRKIIHQ